MLFRAFPLLLAEAHLAKEYYLECRSQSRLDSCSLPHKREQVYFKLSKGKANQKHNQQINCDF